ncbi:uncharacterized protein LOC125319800 [Corvus hawaiiensis]|uniref:uncharacterized protein LOC125319800 n=1 Tax=Corvus hawaiiensis TaxID=134902 RepID=UPI002018D6AA|nr:uncharacterized protein LOC125319800 [Corvus hawaiiensis]
MIFKAENTFKAVNAVPQTHTHLEQNVWVTLAKATREETLCLSPALPQNPFTTCLISVPLTACELQQLCNSTPASAACPATGVWQQLSHLGTFSHPALSPQELQILGTLNADSCTNFKFISTRNSPIAWWVNATIPWYQNASHWCNSTTAQLTLSFTTHMQLSQGIFLICGDQAWAGVPMEIKGGPCTLGKLTLSKYNCCSMDPTKPNSPPTYSEPHMLLLLTAEILLSSGTLKTITVFLLAPGVASAKTLTSLNKLGCWLAKFSNATDIAIYDLLVDADSIRHATLQN